MNQTLEQALIYAADHSPYYRRTLAGKDLQDLTSIPFTTKEQFSEHNADFLCVERTRIAEFVTTSGTMGQPVNYFLTKGDLDRLARNEAMSFACAGVQPGDVLMLTTTMDRRFMAGLAYYLGAQELGCGFIRTGPGVPHLQWDSIARFQPTHLIAVPSFIPKLLAWAKENGIDPNSTSVRSIICIGEPVRNDRFELNALGQRITQDWNVSLASTYASTEMATAFTECEHGLGGHLNQDLLHLEVLDEDGKAVQNGQAGEVVFTTLGVEATPLVRYRSGDICTLHSSPCPCGRTTPRLGPVLGRKGHMIKYKGTTLYPALIFDILDRFEQIEEHLVEVSTNEFGQDHVRVLLHDHLDHAQFVLRVKESFQGRLRVTPEISFVRKEELLALKFPESSRKPIKLLDRRTL